VAYVTSACVAELRARGVEVTELVGQDGGSPALDGLRTVWRNRGPIRQAAVVHLEVGLTALSTFWIGLWVSLLRRDLVTVVHDGPSIVKSPGSGVIRTSAGRRDAVAHKVFAPVLDRPLRAMVRRATQCWVTYSERARDELEGAGLQPVRVVPLGADPPTASSPPSMGKTVVFAGYIAQSKGIDVLLDAWETVSAHTDLQLIIVGGERRHYVSYAESLRQRIETTDLPVEWSGWVSDDVLARTIAEAAIVVLPYRTSNPVSGILVRAAVEGRAIVATAVPAFVDMLEDGITGMIVEPGNVDGLARAIATLAADDEARDALGQAAASWAAVHCTWSGHVDALEEAYGLPGRAGRLLVQ
jgi:glycosyltransferase involved in cell wall biosynthesis